jgi:hypothetical protein
VASAASYSVPVVAVGPEPLVARAAGAPVPVLVPVVAAAPLRVLQALTAALAPSLGQVVAVVVAALMALSAHLLRHRT